MRRSWTRQGSRVPHRCVSASRRNRPVAGLTVQPIPEVLFAHVAMPGVTPGQGAAVDSVASGSLGALAGLKKSDLLLTYRGVAIENPDHFKRLVEAAPPLEKAPLKL